MLNLNHKAKRDLLTGMDYVRDNSLVTQREYNYDALGRPMTRDTRYPNKAIHHADAFTYNKRSELTGALLDGNAYTYAYDNIGNREIAQEAAEDITYDANDLNQYTRISTNGEDFTPEYDADGNQTLVQTSTGIWRVQYNGQNRAIKFEGKDGHTVITCGYDYMGRRFEKKVVTNGTTTLHERYIYRGYLQITALDMLHDAFLIHSIIWDPTQEIATRPLAIQKDGTWYTYGWDLTKNICELYDQEGFISTIYTYSPYGQVTAEGDVTQCIQWSSEYHDAETGLVYYNFRYYNPLDGRWTRRDMLGERNGRNLCLYANNAPQVGGDILGLSFWDSVYNTYRILSFPVRMLQTKIITWPINKLLNTFGIEEVTPLPSSEECLEECGESSRCKREGGCCMRRTNIAKTFEEDKYQPEINGCGPQNWWINPIPDSMEYPMKYDFEQACNEHDKCYGTCGNGKEACDNAFKTSIMSTCEKLPIWESPGCREAAETYYNAVYRQATNAYEEGQDKGCKWEKCK